MRVAVVGHVEWVEFLRVGSVPAPGEIVHAGSVWAGPAGGGAVAAVQLRKLAGACTFFTALGDDDLGGRALAGLRELGVDVHAVFRPDAQRRAFTFVDDDGERTITVVGNRLGPHEADPLPWEDLAGFDALYFCAGDDGALRRSRTARTLVVTARERDRLRRAGVAVDAVAGSGEDGAESFTPGEFGEALSVITEGDGGGGWARAGGTSGRWEPAPVPGPVVDTYGAGDSFVAGFTFALGRGDSDPFALAAACGAAVLTGRGPYEGQLELL